LRKLAIIAALLALALAAAVYSGIFSRDPAQAAGTQRAAQNGEGRGGGPRGGGFGGGGFGGRGGGFQRPPMTVELASTARATVSQRLTVVGNLIGESTVAVAPKTAGRLEQVYVRLGDRVRRGQRIATIEDQEIREQVRQAEASFEVARATIRQREADLQLAQTNVERSRNLFARELLPRQTLDDNEARYQAAIAQLDLARAQNTQSQARLDELRINLANTVIVSPVDGFVARRAADPGAFVSQNAPVVDVVDIGRVRLVANVVEKDLRQVGIGDAALVEVDAFPGDTFKGRIARVAPVLDPSTRTASIEIEIPNADFRLKPGMYARVGITTQSRENALVVPPNAVVDLDGRRGVFLAKDNAAVFRPVEVGIEDAARVEILSGLTDGERVITTGAAGLRDGDQILLAGAEQDGRGESGGDGRGRARGTPPGGRRGGRG
jgi:RND family efflux transporter MFP subunit